MVDSARSGGRPMLWASLESLSLALVSFAMLAMLARYLGAESFGQAAIALGVVQIACSFVESFFHDAVVQRKDLQPAEVDAAHTSGVLVALLLVAAISAWGGLAAALRPADAAVGVAELSLWMAPSVLVAAWTAMSIAQLRRRLAMRQLALAMAGSRLLAGMAAIFALWQGAGVWALVLNQNLAALTLLLLLLLVRAPQARLSQDLAGAKRLAGYAAWNSVSGLLNANMSRVFQVACGFVLPAAVVGQIALALRIVEMLVSVLVTGVSRVTLSRLAVAAHGGHDAAAVFITTTRRLSFVMLPVLLLMAVLAEPLVLFIGHGGWSQAASLVLWFTLAQALRCPTFLANTLFLALGRPRLSLWLSLAELGSLALLAGVLQTPLAWVARLVVVLPLVLLMLQRQCAVGPGLLLSAVREPFLAAVAMALLLQGVLAALGPPAPSPLVTLVAGALAGALLYTLFATWLLGANRVSAVWRQLSGPSTN